jgi:nucleoside-diphosphate-sugar epimerase
LSDVLVTGTGFVGANIASKFIEEGHTVTALDINPKLPRFLHEAQKAGKLNVVNGDTKSPSSVEDAVKKENPRIIVHTATFLNPTEAHNVFEVNVRGTANVLELARKYDLTTVYLSSGAIYGQMQGTADIHEDSEFGPAYPPRQGIDNASGAAYCMSKRLGEQWAAMYRGLYGLRITALRLGWVYGRGITDYRLNTAISLFIRKALVGEPIEIPYGGDTFVDFVHVSDVADVAFSAGTFTTPESFSFNVAYEEGYRFSEVAEAVRHAIPAAKISLGPGLWPSAEVPIPRGGPSFPAERHMSIERAKKELAYAPKFDLQTGVDNYLSWIKENWDVCSPEAVPFPKWA